MGVSIWILKAVVNRTLRRALATQDRPYLQRRFTGDDVEQIIRSVWKNFGELRPAVPKEGTLGARMNLIFAAVTIACDRAFQFAGLNAEQSSRLIAELSWSIYEKWGLLPLFASRVATRDPLKRLSICTRMFRAFPFNPPSYIMKDVPDENAVVFEVRRCPIAEYFRSHQLENLCQQTWCNLDFPLAGMWGGKLERKMTLVGGDQYCDFRWVVDGDQSRAKR